MQQFRDFGAVAALLGRVADGGAVDAFWGQRLAMMCEHPGGGVPGVHVFTEWTAPLGRR
jgi:hypothetical protein